jgi:uncharacterized protein
VIAVDTNILVYGHREESQWYNQARGCIQSLAEGNLPWLIPWPCLHEFLTIVTHSRIYKPPTPLDRALEQIEYWLESPKVITGAEGTLYWPIFKQIVTQSKAAGPVVHDAKIAAICLEHDIDVLWTADRDFSRFPGLPVKNPLIGG